MKRSVTPFGRSWWKENERKAEEDWGDYVQKEIGLSNYVARDRGK